MSSMGPVNATKPKHGECRYCWDENHSRDTAFHFESRQRMIGPVCGHRLRAPKRAWPQFKNNRAHDQLRRGHPEYLTDYWYRRAMLPDFCGEFGELVPGPVNARIMASRYAI